MGRKISTGSGELKKSPTAYLTEKEGTKIVGTLKGRFEKSNFPGKFSYLIAVEDTDASIRLWNKETKKDEEAEIAVGDRVFINGTTVLQSALEQVKDEERVEIIYTGKGVAKKGRKAPFLFDVTVLD